MPSRLRASLFVITVAVFAEACTSTPACVPGSTQACLCVGGGVGVQSCIAGGTYGACDCGAAPDGGIDDPIATIEAVCDALAASPHRCDSACMYARDDVYMDCADEAMGLQPYDPPSEWASWEDCTRGCENVAGCSGPVIYECRCQALCAAERAPAFQQALAAWRSCSGMSYRLECL